jgi:sec-independent protein translocase protein TatA
MNRVGLTEFLLILAIVVVIFGANRLPELGRGIGRGIRSFKESLREGANDKS